MSEHAIELGTRLRVRREVAWSRLGDDVVALHLGSQAYFRLNRTAARALECLQDARTVAAVRDRLLAEFDVSPDRCEEHLRGLLRQMLDHGLVETVGRSAPVS